MPNARQTSGSCCAHQMSTVSCRVGGSGKRFAISWASSSAVRRGTDCFTWTLGSASAPLAVAAVCLGVKAWELPGAAWRE